MAKQQMPKVGDRIKACDDGVITEVIDGEGRGWIYKIILAQTTAAGTPTNIPLALKVIDIPLAEEPKGACDEWGDTVGPFVVAKDGHNVHPNVCKLYRFGRHNWRTFCVREYVEGVSLKQLVEERQRLSISETAGIIKQVAGGLKYWQKAMGVRRWDLRPSTIMLAKQGNGYRVKLTELGLSELFKPLIPAHEKRDPGHDLLRLVVFCLSGHLDQTPSDVPGLPDSVRSLFKKDRLSMDKVVSVLNRECLLSRFPFKSGNSL